MTGNETRRRADDGPARPATPDDSRSPGGDERDRRSDAIDEKDPKRRPTPADVARITARKAHDTLGVPEV
ncbi:hypothetical protein [Streptomyces sp. RerS4]|uniref:hypothetical protein n=1 Tax=Streptomyces sp. RerS4 TaxID=2942449 RepID=UPI00201BF5B4|nr:hypothetical protein [Streptomyces sp. RerS4]UQW99589.1 hypothetical protein M4D82_02845 [Streptomyces sp. RerS4]